LKGASGDEVGVVEVEVAVGVEVGVGVEVAVGVGVAVGGSTSVAALRRDGALACDFFNPR
jgi:hypothetical protein